MSGYHFAEAFQSLTPLFPPTPHYLTTIICLFSSLSLPLSLSFPSSQVEDSSFTNCQGGGNGGGLSVKGHSAVLSNLDFSSCTAQGNGGGLAIDTTDNNSLSAVRAPVSDITVTGCVATNGGGIALLGPGWVTLKNVALNDNTATVSGGGLYFGSAVEDVTLDGTHEITGNEAGASGGGWFVGTEQPYFITYVSAIENIRTIRGNDANAGAANIACPENIGGTGCPECTKCNDGVCAVTGNPIRNQFTAPEDIESDQDQICICYRYATANEDGTCTCPDDIAASHSDLECPGASAPCDEDNVNLLGLCLPPPVVGITGAVAGTLIGAGVFVYRRRASDGDANGEETTALATARHSPSRERSGSRPRPSAKKTPPAPPTSGAVRRNSGQRRNSGHRQGSPTKQPRQSSPTKQPRRSSPMKGKARNDAGMSGISGISGISLDTNASVNTQASAVAPRLRRANDGTVLPGNDFS